MIHFFSPHIDDAIISAGGVIANLVRQGEQIVVNSVFSISNWTNPLSRSGNSLPRDVVSITKIRKEEENEVSQYIGYSYRFFDFYDYPLRTTHKDTMEKVQKELEAKTAINDLLYFPIGFGHPDHKIIGGVGRNLINKKRKVKFYEDLPYAIDKSYYASHYNALSAMGFHGKAIHIDINEKIHAVEKYHSQVTQQWMTCLQEYAFNPQDHRYYENIWS